MGCVNNYRFECRYLLQEVLRFDVFRMQTTRVRIHVNTLGADLVGYKGKP